MVPLEPVRGFLPRTTIGKGVKFVVVVVVPVMMMCVDALQSISTSHHSGSCTFLSIPHLSFLSTSPRRNVSRKETVSGSDCHNTDASSSCSILSNDPFVKAMIQLQYTSGQQSNIINQLEKAGLWDTTATASTTNNNNSSSSQDAALQLEPSFTLRTLTKDYMIGGGSSVISNRLDDSNNDNGISSSSTTISTFLIRDFQIPPLVAHLTRTALLHLHQNENASRKLQTLEKAAIAIAKEDIQNNIKSDIREAMFTRNDTTLHSNLSPNHELSLTTTTTTASIQPNISWEQRYKSSIVRPVAKRRLAAQQQTTSTTAAPSSSDSGCSTNTNMFTYRLHPLEDYPICQQELQDYFYFMTLPSTDSQEETPIRATTANMYLRHATLFLGWYWSIHLPNVLPPTTTTEDRSKDLLSLYTIFPSKDKEHANSILQYILWLRNTRFIAVSYEASLLRGLCKLLKFRYRREGSVPNSSDLDNDTKMDNDTKTSSNDITSFNDIPVIREVLKLHRDANRRQAVAPRVSNEDQKWLSWPDYIQVVQRTKDDLIAQIQEYEQQGQSELMESKKSIQRRRVAALYQKYLILSFFANIPDRQRTIRELEIGRSFVRDDGNGQWCIKHTPDDYKTGKTYGERPPLQLPTSLTIDIDDFIAQWRPALLQNTEFSGSNVLFLGPRTGVPLTSDAVYQTVSKICYYYTGKRTNPHLLRDMIVTHVRESPTVTEQQLEALALFMGHSAAIQRKSYDRRTLTKKVAPAIALMEQVNANSRSTKEI